MKQAIFALLLSGAICLAGDREQSAFKQMQGLIHSLPRFEQVQADFALTHYQAPASEKKREANARLDKAKEGFKRLRSLLRVGTSIFDYPGLLALSRPRYIEFENKYAMALGIPSEDLRANGQGTEPDKFEVIFDNRGTITEVRPIIVKM